jgi:amidase
MRSVKALVLVVSVAGAPACQRADAPAEAKLGGRLHEFTPDVFHNAFAATTAPVRRVSSGDTIRMTTIDAAGTDEKGVRRAEAGNPQTGPFYIEGAEPGDTVAIHVTRLRLNRDWAISTDTLSNRAITSALAAPINDQGQLVRWRLDLHRGIAMREGASGNLAQYTVPLKPMIGCIALAPANATPPPHTGEFGVWGGNLDFNEIVEGTTGSCPSVFPEASCTSVMPTPRRVMGS